MNRSTEPIDRDAGEANALLQPALGRRLRELRQLRGLSLSDVATATGLSQSFLSLVENGRSDIAIGRLMRIVHAYDARVSDLYPRAETPDGPVVRRGQGRHLRTEEGIDLYLLAPDTNRAMMPVTTTYEPNTRQDGLQGHAGETFLYVLEGTLLLELDGHEPAVLGPGDSAYYRPDPPPKLSNIGDTRLELLGVVSPPIL